MCSVRHLQRHLNLFVWLVAGADLFREKSTIGLVCKVVLNKFGNDGHMDNLCDFK
jgi:hypothetical protein